MNSEMPDRRATTCSRESVISACVETFAAEHAEEAAVMMAVHRDAETDQSRRQAWDQALTLVTRPYRRRQT